MMEGTLGRVCGGVCMAGYALLEYREGIWVDRETLFSRRPAQDP
ncbi:MAG: hypothetical protein ACI8QZ_003206 [Chlamydiales bacterium]|jgi:hypothetical protein